MITVHIAETAKPHCIFVDSKAQRFVNEAMSYMEVGQTIFRHHRDVSTIPCWAILDDQHRQKYVWGGQPPSITPREWLESGYMKKATTLGDLARQCGLDPAALEASIQRFNGFARAGRDADFGRGNRVYDCYYGDATNKPNPTLGTIMRAPFYAVQIWPGDVGTTGGVITDEDAQVVRGDGSVIPGLYAAGNSTASVMGRCYPGPGASIANSMVFGYRAARHALRANL
jgi:3-oxosteroid 1-dehydrogenase